ncbi:trypsin-like serine protease with C-terminal PDZ domain [Mycobacteroides abscessus subsp. bolletii]|uniref:CvpA family protein n=1 Tax=Mycobacteroides abscessus TaxID=36809 RepID=UPI0009276649|nr:CvpA family protein [Mycobacteroides abscessus]SIJ07242.1 trypsin-like serine protease with C-terminal PDZ domain [Mycobacteroides abscessus subsp. bolletii]SLD79899.1 trypsin-like serine protease with C-terminal PDZ domain [Mycobacteroides abscessus subsp. bolletii]SLD86809.1 trypsin-like serine protease with C-terminal PDZ domain [Mycobacteroides abscessus subsp. bolletii]
MTLAQCLDVALGSMSIAAIVLGWRCGALGSLIVFVGVVLGVIAATTFVPHLVGDFGNERVLLTTTLLVTAVFVLVGEVAGAVLGEDFRHTLHSDLLRTIDSTVGLMVQLAAVLMAATLLTAPMMKSMSPQIVSAAQASRALTQINEWAPGPVRVLSCKLAAVLWSPPMKKADS